MDEDVALLDAVFASKGQVRSDKEMVFAVSSGHGLEETHSPFVKKRFETDMLSQLFESFLKGHLGSGPDLRLNVVCRRKHDFKALETPNITVTTWGLWAIRSCQI